MPIKLLIGMALVVYPIVLLVAVMNSKKGDSWECTLMAAALLGTLILSVLCGLVLVFNPS